MVSCRYLCTYLHSHPGSVIEGTDLIIEAIVENMAVKHKLFKELDATAPQVTSLRYKITLT